MTKALLLPQVPLSVPMVASALELSADRMPVPVFRSRQMTPASLRTMNRGLVVCAEILSAGRSDPEKIAWWLLRNQHSEFVRSQLSQRFESSTTANIYFAAYRGVLRACWRLGLMSEEDYRRTVDVGRIKGQSLPAGRWVPLDEREALYRACADGTLLGVRDAAMIAILEGGGLRRDEARRLNVGDYHDGMIRVLHGKGKKQREVPVYDLAHEKIVAWLTASGASDSQDRPLLCGMEKGGGIIRRRISAGAIVTALQARATAAGIGHCSPHDLRRTFASANLDDGVDLVTVSKLMGHSDVNVTSRYDRRGHYAAVRAAETRSDGRRAALKRTGVA